MEMEVELEIQATYKIDTDLLCAECRGIAKRVEICEDCIETVLRHGTLDYLLEALACRS